MINDNVVDYVNAKVIKPRNKEHKIVLKGISVKSTPIKIQRCMALSLGVKLLLNPYYTSHSVKHLMYIFHPTLKHLIFQVKKLGLREVKTC